jgi:putative transport protein
MIQKRGQNIPPTSDVELTSGDILLIVAEQEDALAKAAAKLGRSLATGQMVKDPSALDYIRVFVGKANVVGVSLSQVKLPSGFPAHLLHVRRYDVDLVPSPGLVLEFGDRVGVLTPPDRKEEVRRYFGDTVKSAAEFSYVSLGLGMVLGCCSGLFPFHRGKGSTVLR